MVPVMHGKPEESGPNPQSSDIAYSQSREWDHQGCLGHFQEGQEVHFILGCLHNFSIVDFLLVELSDGLSVIGFEGLHCILTQYLLDLRRQEYRAIIPSNGFGRTRML